MFLFKLWYWLLFWSLLRINYFRRLLLNFIKSCYGFLGMYLGIILIVNVINGKGGGRFKVWIGGFNLGLN